MENLVEYEPRWLYQALKQLQRLPVPKWLIGVVIVLLGTGISHLVAWRSAALDFGAFHIDLLLPSVYIVLVPAVWIWMDKRSLAAVSRFVDFQQHSGEEKDILFSDFLSIPSGLAAVIALFGTFIGWMNYQTISSVTTIYRQVLVPYGIFSFLFTSPLILLLVARVIRQSIITRRLYANMNINIFNLSAIYTLSRFLSQSSLLLVVIFVGLGLTGQDAIEYYTEPRFIVTQIIIFASFLTFFLYQLTGIRERLETEKSLKLKNAAANLDEIYSRINEEADRGNYAKVAELQSAAATLKENWESVRRLSTWPWEPVTLRNFLLPLLFPVIVYLLQQYIAQVLGF